VADLVSATSSADTLIYKLMATAILTLPVISRESSGCGKLEDSF
jgi:hypothetical protein